MLWVLNLWVIGINFVPFIFQKVNLWTAQTIFSQFMSLIMLACMVFNKPRLNIRAKYLGAFLIWATISTLVTTYSQVTKNDITFQNFFQFFNLLCAFMFFVSISTCMNKDAIEKTIIVFKWVVIATLFLCFLQAVGYSQFWTLLYKEHKTYAHVFNNPVTGFLGQPTHLATFLGLSVPLFLRDFKRVDILTLIFVGVLLGFFTGTTKNDIAVSGIIVGLVSACYYAFKENMRLFKIIVPFFLVIFLFAFIVGSLNFHSVFEDNARLDIWKYYIEKAKGYSVIGAGLGFINSTFRGTPYPMANHAHNEFLQIWIELGLAGLIIVLGVIREFFTLNTSGSLGNLCKSIFLGFLVGCLFNPTAHVWAVVMFPLCAYAFTHALASEEE